MDAAIRVMARNGYVNMSVGDVLAEAGLSTRGFYRHFDSKDALLAALMRREAESAERSLERAIASASGPRAALEAWVERVLDLFYEPRRAARTGLFTTPAVLGSFPMAEQLMEMRWILARPLVAVLRAGHDTEQLHSPNPEADATSLFALLSSAAVEPHAHCGERDSARALVARFAWPALGLSGGRGAAAAGREARRSR
jgi:AcrR family transcriptional regulator